MSSFGLPAKMTKAVPQWNDDIVKRVISLYTIDLKSTSQISTLVEISQTAVMNILKNHNIPRRSLSQSQTLIQSTPRVDDKIWCSHEQKYVDRILFSESAIVRYDSGFRSAENCKKCSHEIMLSRNKNLRLNVLLKIAKFHNREVVCFRCGNDNENILEVAHIDSTSGSTSEQRKYGSLYNFLYQVYINKRELGDLGILCPTCNIREEYEKGYRNRNSIASKIHQEAIIVIARNNGIPVKCESCPESDILTIEHKDGGGRRDINNYGNAISLYRAIIKGNRVTSDLGISCPNCQRIREIKNEG